MKQIHQYTSLCQTPILSMRSIFSKIKYYIILSNLILTVGPLLVYILLKKNSYQNILYLQNSQVVSYAISFDAFHYLSNQYNWENNFAFLPGYIFIRIFYTFIFNQSKILTVVALIITNKILTCVSAIELYRIAYYLTQNKKVAKIASIVFIFNGASIFYHVVYSQALYTFVIFTAIRLYLKNKQISQTLIESPIQYIKINIVSFLLFFLSSSIRTTALFYSILPGWEILKKFFQSLKSLRLIASIKIFISGFITLLFFQMFFIGYLYYAYIHFCDHSPDRPLFCKDLIPNIYSYIQTKFWDVGFLNYYRLNHAFQITMGIPSIIIALITMKNTIKKWTELTISYWFLLYVTIFYTVIQSSARFFSTHPIYNIYLALHLNKEKNFHFTQKLVIFYLICYNILGIFAYSVRCSWI